MIILCATFTWFRSKYSLLYLAFNANFSIWCQFRHVMSSNIGISIFSRQNHRMMPILAFNAIIQCIQCQIWYSVPKWKLNVACFREGQKVGHLTLMYSKLPHFWRIWPKSDLPRIPPTQDMTWLAAHNTDFHRTLPMSLKGLVASSPAVSPPKLQHDG
jgi:hypothetical protein